MSSKGSGKAECEWGALRQRVELSVVITGAPNLSNEVGVRGEVRSVSKRESDVR